MGEINLNDEEERIAIEAAKYFEDYMVANDDMKNAETARRILWKLEQQ